MIAFLLIVSTSRADRLTAEITLTDRSPREVTLDAPGVLPTVVTLDGWTDRAAVPLVLLDPSAEPKFDVPGATISVTRTPEDPSRRAIGPDLSSAVMGEEAYLPTFGWRPGAEAMLRFRVVLAGALLAMAFLGATLLRGRRAVLVVLGITAASVGAIALWWRAQPRVLEMSGSIVVKRLDGTEQRDRWRFFTTRHASATIEIALTGDAVPVFVDAAHAQGVGARMRVDPTKRTRTLTATLKHGECTAVVERNAHADPRDGAEMGQIAQRLYVSTRAVVHERKRGEVLLDEVNTP